MSQKCKFTEDIIKFLLEWAFCSGLLSVLLIGVIFISLGAWSFIDWSNHFNEVLTVTGFKVRTAILLIAIFGLLFRWEMFREDIF